MAVAARGSIIILARQGEGVSRFARVMKSARLANAKAREIARSRARKDKHTRFALDGHHHHHHAQLAAL